MGWNSWNVLIKTIKGRKYAYYQQSIREGKKVRTVNKYIGPFSGDDIAAFKAAKLAELQASQETEGQTLRERRRMASHIGLDLEKGETIDDMMRRHQREAQQVIDNAADWAYKTMGEPKDRPSRVEKPVGIEAPDKPPANSHPDRLQFPDVWTRNETFEKIAQEKNPTESEAKETETSEEPTAAAQNEAAPHA